MLSRSLMISMALIATELEGRPLHVGMDETG